MSRKHKLRSRESNCAGGHDAPPRFKALLNMLAVKRRRAQVLFSRVHRGRCSPFIDPEVHNFLRDRLGPMDEFRDMVKALHRAGPIIGLSVPK
jgi:hypothetical protein